MLRRASITKARLMATEKDYQRQLLRDKLTIEAYESVIGEVVRAEDGRLMEPKERTQSWKDFKREGLLSADWDKPERSKDDLQPWVNRASVLIGSLLIALDALSPHVTATILLLGCLLIGMPWFTSMPKDSPTSDLAPTAGRLPIPPAPPVTPGIGRVGGMPPANNPLTSPSETRWIIDTLLPQKQKQQQLHAQIEKRAKHAEALYDEWHKTHAAPESPYSPFVVPDAPGAVLKSR